MSNNDFEIKNGVLRKYSGQDSEVVIPKGVTKIWNFAFMNCDKISSIIIPDSVTEIRSTAFFGLAKKLESVTFPNSKNLRIINNEGYFSVLEGCKSTINIVFPKGIKSFKGTALECIWKHFFISEEKIIMMSSFLRQYTDLIKSDATLNRTFKTNKAKIVELAVKNDDIETIELLFSLYKKVLLDDLDKFIDMSTESTTVTAFLVDYKAKHYSAEKQQEIENDKLEKELGFKQRTVADWKKIFIFENKNNGIIIKKYKGNETAVEIPEIIGKKKVISIDSAFERNTSITSVTIPDSVTEICGSAFFGCSNLVNVNITKDITEINTYTFKGCTKLADKDGFVIVNNILFDYIGDESKIIIPDTVKVVSGAIFGGKEKNIVSVTIPEGVTEIEYSTFSGCVNLTEVNIPNSVVEIGWAFDGCTSLEVLFIPDSVTKIDSWAFRECKAKLTIKCSAGSYAEKYAKENGIKFETV